LFLPVPSLVLPACRRHASNTVVSLSAPPPPAPRPKPHSSVRGLEQALSPPAHPAPLIIAPRADGGVAVRAAANLATAAAMTGVTLSAADAAGIPLPLLSASLAGASLLTGAVSAHMRHSWAHILEPVAPLLIRRRMYEAQADSRRMLVRAASRVRRAIEDRIKGAPPPADTSSPHQEADARPLATPQARDQPASHSRGTASARVAVRRLGRLCGGVCADVARRVGSTCQTVRSRMDAHLDVLAPWALAAVGVAVQMAAREGDGNALAPGNAWGARGGRQGHPSRLAKKS
jgi:hypothetical protein